MIVRDNDNKLCRSCLFERYFCLGRDAAVGSNSPHAVVEIDIFAVVFDTFDHIELHSVSFVEFLLSVLVVEKPCRFHLQINYISNDYFQ